MELRREQRVRVEVVVGGLRRARHAARRRLVGRRAAGGGQRVPGKGAVLRGRGDAAKDGTEGIHKSTVEEGKEEERERERILIVKQQ